jgi:hypothetical protein
MTKVRFVSAIYDISDGLRGPTYPAVLWERAVELSSFLPGGLHVCCDSAAAAHYSAAHGNLHIYPLPLPMGLPSEAALPLTRHSQKDTHAYLALQNAKSEFLLHVKQQSPPEIQTFIWIDAGIRKVLQSPERLLPRLRALGNAVYPTDAIRLPGPGWGLTADANRLTASIWWRFCGGVVIVPTGLVERFAEECRWGIQQLWTTTGRVTWEVNVWTYLEACGRLPVVLVPGDHNDTILDALFMT